MSATTNLLARTAADIMQTEILTVSTSARLTEVAQLLGEHQVGGVPVTDEAGHIVGVVSLRDIVGHYAGDDDARTGGHYYTAAHEVDDETFEVDVPEDSVAVVSDVMSAQVYSVPQDATLATIAHRMVELKIHRILVTDNKKRHVGLISAFDVLRAIGKAR